MYTSSVSARVKAWRGAVACGVVVTAAGLLGGATLERNRDYRNQFRMWTDVVAKRPDNHRAQLNLGNEYYRRKDYETALIHYREFGRIKPDYVTPFQYAAHCSWFLGRIDEAFGFYEAAAEVEEREFPNEFTVRLEYAGRLLRAQRLVEALGVCNAILRTQPTDPKVVAQVERLRQRVLGRPSG